MIFILYCTANQTLATVIYLYYNKKVVYKGSGLLIVCWLGFFSKKKYYTFLYHCSRLLIVWWNIVYIGLSTQCHGYSGLRQLLPWGRWAPSLL